jgi:LCP family protein required for cell wall assembly
VFFFDDAFDDEARLPERIAQDQPTERIPVFRLREGPTRSGREGPSTPERNGPAKDRRAGRITPEREGPTTRRRAGPTKPGHAGPATTGRHSRRPEAPVTPARRHARPIPERAVRTPLPARPRHFQPELRDQGHRRRRRGRSLWWHIGTVALSFTVLLVLAAGAIAGYAYQKYNNQITRVSVLQRDDPHIRNAARQQHAENFLVIGSDTRAGVDAKFGNVTGARSDTTILVHLSPDRVKATIVSIPRDAWVAIPSCTSPGGRAVPEHSDMFNSAFTVGGPKCTIATVQKLTGIAVTHFVEVDFSGFKSMVTAMGSVTVCSPQSVSDPGSGLRLHPGQNRLGGAQALAYVRARETLGDGSDLGRIKRQQVFLGAVLRQAMNGSMLSNPARLTSFLDAATKAITVDKGTSFRDLRALATSMRGLDPSRVTFYTAPIADQNYTPPGTSMSGRVLLDSVQGRALYDSIINDRKPVWVKRPAGNPTTPSAVATRPSSPAPTGTSPAPKPGFNAAQQTCSL